MTDDKTALAKLAAMVREHPRASTRSGVLASLLIAIDKHDCGESSALRARVAELERERDAETNRAFEHAKTIDVLRMERTAAVCERDALAAEVERLRAALHSIACSSLELTGLDYATQLATRDRLRGLNEAANAALAAPSPAGAVLAAHTTHVLNENNAWWRDVLTSAPEQHVLGEDDAKALAAFAERVRAEERAKADAEWERATAFGSQPKTPTMKEIIAAHDAEVRRAALDDAAKAIEAKKKGYTVDVFSGVLIADVDGPWFLKSECAETVRALATATPATPKEET